MYVWVFLSGGGGRLLPVRGVGLECLVMGRGVLHLLHLRAIVLQNT